MAAYNQSNTDPVSVNGMYLKFYLDILRGMAETFTIEGELGTEAFNKYALFIRSTVPKKDLRDEIDVEVGEITKKINAGLYGDIGKSQENYVRGFCVVSAAMKFIGDAFHIIQNDSASLMDITDDELMVELERYAMYRKVRISVGNDKEHLKLLEKKIADGTIPNMRSLVEELTIPAEAIPQDDPITQDDMAGDTNDRRY